MSMLKIAGIIGTLVTLGAATPALADECHHQGYTQYEQPYQAYQPPVTYYAPPRYVAPPVTYYTPAPRVYVAPRWHWGRSWGRVGWHRR